MDPESQNQNVANEPESSATTSNPTNSDLNSNPTKVDAQNDHKIGNDKSEPWHLPISKEGIFAIIKNAQTSSSSSPRTARIDPYPSLTTEDHLSIILEPKMFRKDAGTSKQKFEETNEVETCDFSVEMDENQPGEPNSLFETQDIEADQKEVQIDSLNIGEISEDGIKLDNEPQFDIQNVKRSVTIVLDSTIFSQIDPFSCGSETLESSKIVELKELPDEAMDLFDIEHNVEIQSSTSNYNSENTSSEDDFFLDEQESKIFGAEYLTEAPSQSVDDFPDKFMEASDIEQESEDVSENQSGDGMSCKFEEVSNAYDLAETQRVVQDYNYQVQESGNFLVEINEAEILTPPEEYAEGYIPTPSDCNEQCASGSKSLDTEILDEELNFVAPNNEGVELITISEASKNGDVDVLKRKNTEKEPNKKFWDSSDSIQGFFEEKRQNLSLPLAGEAAPTVSQNDGFVDHGQEPIGCTFDETDNDDFCTEESKHEKPIDVNVLFKNGNNELDTDEEMTGTGIGCTMLRDQDLGISSPEFRGRTNSKAFRQLKVAASVVLDFPKKVKNKMTKKDNKKRRTRTCCMIF